MEDNKKHYTDLDIYEEIINPINSKTCKTAELADKLGISADELKGYIKQNGYKWMGSTYVKADSLPKKKKEVSQSKENSERVKVTYNIDRELQELVKLQAVKEKIDCRDVIEKAIQMYISKETKEALKYLNGSK